MNTSKPNFYKNRGLAYYGKIQYEKAIEQFNKSISIDPEYQYAYADRGDTYLKLNNSANATLDFKKACELGHKESCIKIGSSDSVSNNSLGNLSKEVDNLAQDNKLKPSNGGLNTSKENESIKPTLKIEMSAPTRLFFKKGVSFGHNSHINFACNQCHGAGAIGKITDFGKKFGHNNCKDCHKENGGPTGCTGCHKE